MLRMAVTTALRWLAASSAPLSIAIRAFSAASAISHRQALLPIPQPFHSSLGFPRGYARRSTVSEDELTSKDFSEAEEHSDDYSAPEIEEDEFSYFPEEMDDDAYKSEESECFCGGDSGPGVAFQNLGFVFVFGMVMSAVEKEDISLPLPSPSSPSLELDPLLKALTERKLSFPKHVVSLVAELKDVRSRLASQEEPLF